MNEDELKGHLQAADAAAGAPSPLPADFGARVLRRRRQGRRRCRMAWGVTAAAAAAGLVVAACAVLPRPGGARRPAGPAARQVAGEGRAQEVALVRARLRALRAEAEACSAVVEGVLAMERRRAGAPRVLARRGDALERVRRQVDRAAYLTVRRVDIVLNESGDAAGAAAGYQQVMDVFPETFWATLARQRRDALRKATGDSL